MERKILAAIDPTSHWRNVLHYLCLLFAHQPDTALHLLSIVPCHAGKAGRNLLDQQELLSVVDAATRKKYTESRQHLEMLRQKLIACGFQQEQITAEVRLSQAGVAADLLFTARQDLYDALLIGKRDLSLLEKMIAGSISAEILKNNNGLPVWIVSGAIDSQRFLVPVDCTPHTLNAVDHLAFMLRDNPHAEITLFHSCSLLASEKIVPKEQFYEKWGKAWCDEHLQGEEDGHYHFHAPEQILKEAGFPLTRVQRLKTEKGIEPGQQIVRHVKHGEYGTIVMGRRRKNVDKGIFRGVSDRVLANVKNVAIWILG